MFTYDSETEVKEKANILEVVEDFVKLSAKGLNYIGLCPFHNEKTPSFYVSPSKAIFKCFGCGKSGDAIEFIQEHEKSSYPETLEYLAKKYNITLIKEGQQTYIKPVWRNNTNLSPKIVEWFAKRKISPNTLLEMKISEGIESMPTDKGWEEMNTIHFNYFRNDELVNTKFRGKNKSFKLVSGAELILYNIDSLKGKKEAFWVEGEVDALSVIEAGYMKDYAIISVPNGASKHKNNLSYLNNSINELEHIEIHHLGFDNDSNGRKLREEIADRLGKHKCDYIEWKDKKDANDVLMQYGIQGVIECCSNPVKFPLEGAFTISDFAYEIEDMYNQGLPKGVSCGLRNFPVSFVKGYLAIWTGISAMGKSEAVDEICTRLLCKHNWKVAYYSPENKPTQLHYSKLACRIVGKPWDGPNRMTKEENRQVQSFLEKKVWFIKPEKDFSLDSVLKSIRDLQIRYGLDQFVIDAWYNLEFEEENTRSINKALNKIALFCEANNLLGHIIAHSVKPEEDKKTGKPKVPKLYNISGSNNFHNKADYGFSIHIDEEIAYFHTLKRKFKHWGFLGSPGYLYDANSGRYYASGYPDFTNWITGKQNTQPSTELPLDNISEFNADEEPF